MEILRHQFKAALDNSNVFEWNVDTGGGVDLDIVGDSDERLFAAHFETNALELERARTLARAVSELLSDGEPSAPTKTTPLGKYVFEWSRTSEGVDCGIAVSITDAEDDQLVLRRFGQPGASRGEYFAKMVTAAFEAGMVEAGFPAIVIPSEAFGISDDEVAAFFDRTLSIVPLRPGQLAVQHAAGPGEVKALLEIGHWIVDVGPTLLVDFLVAYGGAEFLKGFAGEAGKDVYHAAKRATGVTWDGVKRLAGRIRESWKAGNRPAGWEVPQLSIQAKGPHPVSGQFYNVVLMLDDLSDETRVDADVAAIESIFLPFLACYSRDRTDPIVRIQRAEGPATWEIIDWSGGMVQVSIPRSAEGRGSRVTFTTDPFEQHFDPAPMVACLEKLGLERLGGA
jgi:hypothetical protein